MATRKFTRRKAIPPLSVHVAATEARTPVPVISDLVSQVLEISCRVAVYAHAAEHLDNDEAPQARREAAAALPVALNEVRADLQALMERLEQLNPEARA
jgi:hypothetical protein